MILNGKVATPKEEWDYKMALSRAKFEEGQYQNRATHYQGREVASPAPSGGPRRSQEGGGNPKKEEKKNQAKKVVSKIFDLHGVTESEINTDVDGTVTKIEKKTPSSVFDNYRNEEGEPFHSEARESARSSIATPPATVSSLMAGGSPNSRGGGARRGLIERVTPWLHPTEDRYMTEDEYYGGPAAHWESAPINKTVVLNPETGEFEVQSEPDPVINDTGLVSATDNDLYLAQDLARQDADQRDLLELKDRHPDLFVKMMNEGGFESRPDPHPHAGEGFIENEEGEIVPVNNIIDDGKWAPDKGLITEPSKYVPPPSPHSILEEEAEELANNLKDIPVAPDKGIQLEDVVKTLSEEDPSGEAIKTINDFATWADTVPDEVAIEEAKTYLQGLKDSPTVTQRFRKAMAIAMMAMVFGDDFSTAMNTGFGVIADDYAEEEAEEEKEEAARLAKLEAQNTADIALAKQIAKEERDLAKTIAAEERALGRQLDSEERAFYKTIAAEQRALTRAIAAEQRGNATWADRLVITENIAHQKLLAQLDRAASAETLADAKAITADNFAFIKERSSNHWQNLSTKAREKFNNVDNFQTQMDGALGWMVRNWSGQVDFGNNVDQRVAFEKAFEEWHHDTQRFDTADFATYIQDAFIKNKFTSEATYIEPSLIMPDLARDPSQRTHANETVAKLYKKVETQVIPGVGTEKHALMLLKKDFNHYRDYESNGTKVEEGKVSSRYDKLLKHANKLGEGVFTRFVNQLPASSIWGFVYDPEAKGKSAAELGKLSAIYLREH